MTDSTERIIRESQSAEELIDAIDELKNDDMLDNMKPELRAEVEQCVRGLGEHSVRDKGA